MATIDTVLKHSKLTGEQLHEPKGIENADNGSVYFANGLGTGTWRNPSIEDLNLQTVTVSETVLEENAEIVPLTTDLNYIQKNNVTRTTSFAESNENFYELTTKCEELRNQLAVSNRNIAVLRETIESLRAALLNLGVLKNG